jgi:hypothetical protein
VLNIDHHPDNRRYGTSLDRSIRSRHGEMVFDLVRALGLR